MGIQFFLALLCCVALPTLLSRLLRVHKIFPLVFIQLLLGLTLRLSGCGDWLKGHGVDLLHGPLGDSLHGLGLLGVSLLIALSGSEAAPQHCTRGAWSFIPISIVGFGGTFAIGTMLGHTLAVHNPGLIGEHAHLWTFSFAVGLALSITALPVLAAVLREIGLNDTPLGNLATNCSMLDEVWMWLGLAILLSLSSTVASGPAAMMLELAGCFGAQLLVRAWLRRWLDRAERSTGDRIILSLSVIFVCAAATDLIGLHPMLGAFLAGATLPRKAFNGWRESLAQINQIILLPFTFIMSGMQLQLDIGNPEFYSLMAAVTITAVLCKFGGVALTARSMGRPWRYSLTLGSLMQCKGLMELVAIGILLDAKIISGTVFSALATMALISTFVTAPALRFLLRGSRGQAVAFGAAV